MNIKSKKALVLTLLITVLMIASLAYVWNRNDKTNYPGEANSSIDYSPPTDREIQAGNEIKESQPDNKEDKDVSNVDSDSSEIKNTDVIITDASQYNDVIEVRAFMPNIIQAGNCKIVFSKDDKVLEFNEPAFPDASSTICVSENIKRSEFLQNGLWNISVSFTSENYTGSKTSTIEIK